MIGTYLVLANLKNKLPEHSYLIPWYRILLEEIVVSQLKNSPTFCGTLRFITMFTVSHHRTLILSQMYPIHAVTSHFLQDTFYCPLICSFISEVACSPSGFLKIVRPSKW
jgi:hypothetical protein